MKDLWLKLGCHLTGHNYFLVKNSSYSSTRAVKKFFSALLIVGLIWGFIGFNFSQRYLGTSDLTSSIVALVMVILVIQIERQIILSSGNKKGAYIFRIVIGVVMAVIGSVIIDQVIFKEDIEKAKISQVQDEVNMVLSDKTLQLDNEIREIVQSIAGKEKEYSDLMEELSQKPMIASYSSTTSTQRDSSGRQIASSREVTRVEKENPKVALVSGLESQLSELRERKVKKEEYRMNMRNSLEQELKDRTGFLDELKLMFGILLNSTEAMVVWGLIFIFFFSMELFVLVSKTTDNRNDYDRIIEYQEEVRLNKLDNLQKQLNGGYHKN